MVSWWKFASIHNIPLILWANAESGSILDGGEISSAPIDLHMWHLVEFQLKINPVEITKHTACDNLPDSWLVSPPSSMLIVLSDLIYLHMNDRIARQSVRACVMGPRFNLHHYCVDIKRKSFDAEFWSGRQLARDGASRGWRVTSHTVPHSGKQDFNRLPINFPGGWSSTTNSSITSVTLIF